MKTKLQIIYIAFALSLFTACQTTPIFSDSELTTRVVGTWIRDETYNYGRFIGTLVMKSNGEGSRAFDMVSYARSKAGALATDPQLFETFRWHIDKGVIVFTDRQIKDVDAHSAEWNTTKAGAEHRERVTSLTASDMAVLDPSGKTDQYKKAE